LQQAYEIQKIFSSTLLDQHNFAREESLAGTYALLFYTAYKNILKSYERQHSKILSSCLLISKQSALVTHFQNFQNVCMDSKSHTLLRFINAS